MGIFKIYTGDFGVKVAGVSYSFDHVMSMTIEDPENNKLTRGANASNSSGLPYKEGLKDPKRITVTIRGMSAALKDVLQGVFENQTRVDVFCIDRADGSSKMGRDAILCQQPQQVNLDDSEDAMNVILTFECFLLSEVHKS